MNKSAPQLWPHVKSIFWALSWIYFVRPRVTHQTSLHARHYHPARQNWTRRRKTKGEKEKGERRAETALTSAYQLPHQKLSFGCDFLGQDSNLFGP